MQIKRKLYGFNFNKFLMLQMLRFKILTKIWNYILFSHVRTYAAKKKQFKYCSPPLVVGRHEQTIILEEYEVYQIITIIIVRVQTKLGVSYRERKGCNKCWWLLFRIMTIMHLICMFKIMPFSHEWTINSVRVASTFFSSIVIIFPLWMKCTGVLSNFYLKCVL